jgi:hypothetical protein
LTRFGVVLAVLAMAIALATPSNAEAQRRRRRAAAVGTGNLVVETSQEGAEIYVDAELVGTAPLAPLPLEPGTYTVRVTRPGFTEFTDVVEVQRGRDTLVQADLMAVSQVLRVTTEPEGARVFVDGRFAGTTPVDVELQDGEHSIRIAKQGWREVLRTITAQSGRSEDLHVDLERLSDEELREIGLAPPAPALWYERPLTWLLVGGGALLIAAGVVMTVILTADQPTELELFCVDCTLVNPPY